MEREEMYQVNSHKYRSEEHRWGLRGRLLHADSQACYTYGPAVDNGMLK